MCTTYTDLSWRSTGSRPPLDRLKDFDVDQSTDSRPAKPGAHALWAVDRQSTGARPLVQSPVDRQSTGGRPAAQFCARILTLSLFWFWSYPDTYMIFLALFMLHTCTAWYVYLILRSCGFSVCLGPITRSTSPCHLILSCYVCHAITCFILIIVPCHDIIASLFYSMRGRPFEVVEP